MLESTSPAASHTHTASTICFSPSMPSSFSRLHFGSATWQACCCGWEESSAFWTPQTGADSPGWLFDVSEDNRPPGLCGTSLFCQVVSQRRRRCVHNWTATHCRGKWVREKDLFFFLLLSLTLPFPYLCFVFLDIASSLPTSHFFGRLQMCCFSFFSSFFVLKSFSLRHSSLALVVHIMQGAQLRRQ